MQSATLSPAGGRLVFHEITFLSFISPAFVSFFLTFAPIRRGIMARRYANASRRRRVFANVAVRRPPHTKGGATPLIRLISKANSVSTQGGIKGPSSYEIALSLSLSITSRCNELVSALNSTSARTEACVQRWLPFFGICNYLLRLAGLSGARRLSSEGSRSLP